MRDGQFSQCYILKQDTWLLASLTLVPIVIALIIWAIFSHGIARDLPITVVDNEKSLLSRELIRHLDATPFLAVKQIDSDINQAKQQLTSGDSYAYVVIPTNFTRDIYLGLAPQASTFYNSQFILIGKLINTAVLQAHGTFDAKIGTLKQLQKGQDSTQSALAKTVSVRAQITPLFNKNSNYAQFLVTAIVPTIWQISIILSTVLILTANQRIYGLNKLFREKPLQQMLSLCLFYLPFFLIQGAAFLYWFYIDIGWPNYGSYWPILYAQLITVLACMTMSALFFFISLDATRAMSFSAVYTAPSFAFVGVTFPATDMGALAQMWRSLLPISHYIEAQISQVNYAVSAWRTIADFTPTMLGYLVPLAILLLLIKKHQKSWRQNEPA